MYQLALNRLIYSSVMYIYTYLYTYMHIDTYLELPKYFRAYVYRIEYI
jgi:hypothetical protein